MFRSQFSKTRRANRHRPGVAVLEARLLLSADVLTYHNDVARSGLDPNETVLTPGNVNATSFGKRGFDAVDGQIDAQPLYVANVTIPGQGVHNVLYVATENDSVYAFDADTGAKLWQASMLGPGEVPSDPLGGTISPEIGITATPVIDPSTDTMYVVAMSKLVSGSNTTYIQRIHALDITTGADRVAPTSIDQSITYPGAGPGGNGTDVSFNPEKYDDRDALLLLNGVVYTSWSSHGDTSPYTGWVIGFNASNLGLASVINIDPNGAPTSSFLDDGSGNTFWNSGDGPVADAAGNFYNISGNGPFDETLNAAGFPANGDYGDSDVEFTPTSGGLKVSDYFTPYNQQVMADDDLDLGSSGAILVDVTDGSGASHQLMIGSGKDGNIYVVDTSDMGKFNATSNDIYQELSGALPNGEWGTAAAFDGQVYFGGVGAPLTAFPFVDGYLQATPASQSSHTFGYPGTTPSISSDGNANGIVWAIDDSASTAVLYAYDASNVSNLLYSSTQAADSRDSVGPSTRFMTPTIANGKVYVATATGVAVFGLLPPTVATPASASPSPATATATDLSVLGANPSSPESSLTYTWAATATPTGAPAPTFSVNGTNAAQDTVATFGAAGAYTFRVTIEAPDNLTATSSVNVTVNQTLKSIAVSPLTPTVADGGTQPFTASAEDQFDAPLASQPTFAWSVASGGVGGTVGATGLYTAPATGTGSATVEAASGSVVGAATVSVAYTDATIFTGQTPANASYYGGGPVELGVKFESSAAGYIDGIRFYKGAGNTGTHTGYLWSSTGTLLAQATFADETAGGWQQVDFATPVAIAADTVYVASYDSPTGYFSWTGNGLAAAVTDGPLTAPASGSVGGNGLYVYTTSPGTSFPSLSYQSRNYWVDVAFSNAPATVTSTTPANGAIGAPDTTAITATFNESVQSDTITCTLRNSLHNTIPASFSYNTTTNTATWIPTSPLSPGMTYTATVSGARNVAGFPMASPYTWSFTAVYATIFTTQTPAVASYYGGGEVELGVKFESSEAGYIDGVRFYKGAGNTGTHVGYLWTGTGTLLAQATFTNETANGWQTVTFAAPVAIAADTIYVASYLSPTGYFAYTDGYFAGAVTDGPLTAPASGSPSSNGVYLYGGSGGFPTASYQSRNYWVDVAFSNEPPTVASTTPAGGATGVPASSAITATFDNGPTGAGANTIAFALDDSHNNPVATTFAYDAATDTATWTPNAPLVAGMKYTATVSGARNDAGSPMTSPYTWTFTTAYDTIFTTQTPAVASYYGGGEVELGVKFESSEAGYIDGVRFYKGAGNTGTHVGYLWSSTGTLLAQATFTNETAGGWQTVAFAAPVAIAADTVYVASYLSPTGYFAYTDGYFSGAVTDGPLTAPASGSPSSNGVYLYGGSGGFPTASYQSRNYWVDVTFNPAPVSGTSVVSVSDSPGAASITNGAAPTSPGQGSNGNGPVVATTTSSGSGNGEIGALDTILSDWNSSDPCTAPITGTIKGTGPGHGVAVTKDAEANILLVGTSPPASKWVISYGADTIAKKRQIGGTLI